MKELRVEDLRVTVGDQEIVRGLSLNIPRGEVHALMGPNGSGKSTLAKVLAGHPDYHVTGGKVLVDGENLLELEPDERARRGLFLAFQYPSEIPGVTIANFLRAALQSRLPEGEELEATDYYARLYEKMELLGMDRSFTSRAVNEGFSGGEKKRAEILQMAMLEPKYAVLDETDSGLDIDALKTVAHGVNSLRGPDLGILLITHYQRLLNYIVPETEAKRSWDEVPDDIKRTFERLGIPEQERKFLAGVEAQFDSEAVYSNIKKAVGEQGVIFVGSTEGLKNYPEIFRKWFGKVIPIADNKFSALNSAVFSGGSFIYVPPGVKVKHPLQAYFRINAENFGQFERTLIIADEGAEVTYMEGCTAPKFNTSTLHSAVVELVALKGAKIQYITVQNWANNVFNLVTKRGVAHENAEIKWIDCNIGSRLTMKYPGVVLKGEGARGEVLSIALANDGQHQDTGAKMIHAADETTPNN